MTTFKKLSWVTTNKKTSPSGVFLFSGINPTDSYVESDDFLKDVTKWRLFKSRHLMTTFKSRHLVTSFKSCTQVTKFNIVVAICHNPSSPVHRIGGLFFTYVWD